MCKVSVTMWFGTKKALESILFMDALVMYTYATVLGILLDTKTHLEIIFTTVEFLHGLLAIHYL